MADQTNVVPHTPQGRAGMRFAHDLQARADTIHLEPIGAQHVRLMRWYDEALKLGQMSEIIPDFHRLQIESWIFGRAHSVMGASYTQKRAIDFGVIQRRAWQDERYICAGLNGEGESIVLDLCNFAGPKTDPHVDAYDLAICSEVLEHAEDPFEAFESLRLMLRRGATLLITSPFLWPDHSTKDYPDYWRFTEGAWRLLAKKVGLDVVDIKPTSWTHDGGHLYDLIRKVEGWGFRGLVEGHTGYMCEMRKP